MGLAARVFIPNRDNMENGNFNYPARWYHTWWGVVLAGFLGLFIVAGAGFGALVSSYWWQVKSGRGAELARQINQGRPAPNSNPVAWAVRNELETADDPFLGNPNAGIVIAEFIDFKCPRSREAAAVMRQVAEKYGHKVKIIARDFPAESARPGATQLAELAVCAHEQGRFWEMHDILFSNLDSLPANLSDTEASSLADLAGLDKRRWRDCLNKPQTAVEVNQDYAAGFKYQVKGTPTFFVNGRKVEGAVSWEAWEEYLAGK